MRSLLCLSLELAFVLCGPLIWVVGCITLGTGSVASATGHVTRAACNGDGNTSHVPCITVGTAPNNRKLQAQPVKSNTARGNEKLGPIAGVFGGLLGVPQYYTHLSIYRSGFALETQRAPGPSYRVVGPICSRPVYESGSGDWFHRFNLLEYSSVIPSLDGTLPPRGIVVEQQPDKLKVVGSNPSTPTNRMWGSIPLTASRPGSVARSGVPRVASRAALSTDPPILITAVLQ